MFYALYHIACGYDSYIAGQILGVKQTVIFPEVKWAGWMKLDPFIFKLAFRIKV